MQKVLCFMRNVVVIITALFYFIYLGIIAIFNEPYVEKVFLNYELQKFNRK